MFEIFKKNMEIFPKHFMKYFTIKNTVLFYTSLDKHGNNHVCQVVLINDIHNVINKSEPGKMADGNGSTIILNISYN
jgi:hypothetical protein